MDAALLKDVRIGEYESYTRFVFEFSEPVQVGTINDAPTDWFAVGLGKVNADLKRKIPVDDSGCIREVRLFDHQGTITALIHPGFQRVGYDTFQLDDPPRLVVDLFKAAVAPAESVAPGAIPDQPPPNDADQQAVPSPDTAVTVVAAVTDGETATTAHPAPALEPKGLLSYLYQPQRGQLQFYLWVTLVALCILTAAMALWLRSNRHRKTTAPPAPPGEKAFQKEAEPIIELIDRVERQAAEAEPVIELTERVHHRPSL